MPVPKVVRRRRKPFGDVEPYRVRADRPPVSQSRSGRYQGAGTPKMREEFEGTLAAERREAEAKAKRAERRDDVPRTRGPRATPRTPKFSTAGFRKAIRSFGARDPRRLLLAELVLAMLVIISGRIAEGEVPQPRDLAAPFIVYLVLSFAAEVGGPTARFAAGFGGLILLAIVFANVPSIARVIGVGAGSEVRSEFEAPVT